MSGKQIAIPTAESHPGTVAVQVLNVKTGGMVTAQLPEYLAERFPSYGNVEDVADLMAEVFGDDGANMSIGDLVRVKVPDANSKGFTVGDDVAKNVDGIVILRQERRNYWEKSLEEGGQQAPDCYSRDAVTGNGIYGKGSEENPSGLCEDCPLAQWAEIDGKRVPPPCHQQEAVLMLVEFLPFPLLLTVPRTSLKNFREYWKGFLFAQKLKSLPEVITRVGLNATKNEGGTAYNELTFAIAPDGDLTAGMSRAEKNSYKLVPLSLAEQFRTILVNVDTSGADPERAAAGRTPDGEGGFSVVDDDLGEYANAGVGTEAAAE